SCADAKTILSAEGDFGWSCVPGNPAPSAEQVGIIYEVSPRGFQDPGTTIEATVYDEPVPLGQPASAPNFTVGDVVTDELVAGTTATVNWANFTCPSGTGSLSGFIVTLTNATFDDGSSERTFAVGEFSAQITVADQPGQ